VSIIDQDRLVRIVHRVLLLVKQKCTHLDKQTVQLLTAFRALDALFRSSFAASSLQRHNNPSFNNNNNNNNLTISGIQESFFLSKSAIMDDGLPLTVPLFDSPDDVQRVKNALIEMNNSKSLLEWMNDFKPILASSLDSSILVNSAIIIY
jgi:hypothetical protein